MRKLSLILLLISLTCLPCLAQNVPYQRLLLLVAGPSGDRIDPTEQQVVSYLNQLRGQYNLYNLQMGTMHYDRPQERRLLTQVLGFRPAAGVTVGLVQLSEQGYPQQTLYKSESVTPSTLKAQQRELMGKWSQLTGESVPPELRSATSAGTPPQMTPPSDLGGPPEMTPPSDNGTSSEPVAPPQSGEVYSFEGIRTVVTSLQQKTTSVWDDLKNKPLREDRMDVPVREATVALKQASDQLFQAHKRGVVYPLDLLEQVRARGRDWKHTDPRVYLPVELRSEVQPILNLLEQIEAIEYQGRNT